MRIDQPVHTAVVVHGITRRIRVHSTRLCPKVDHIVLFIQIFNLADELSGRHLGNIDRPSICVFHAHKFFYTIRSKCR